MSSNTPETLLTHARGADPLDRLTPAARRALGRLRHDRLARTRFGAEAFARWTDGTIGWAAVEGVTTDKLMRLALEAGRRFDAAAALRPQAVRCMEVLTRVAPAEAAFHILLGRMHLDEERWVDAIARFSIAIALEGADLGAYAGRALALLGAGERAAALLDIDAAVRADPDGDAELTVRLAKTYRAT